jgi:iduronate 2-sulfatase
VKHWILIFLAHLSIAPLLSSAFCQETKNVLLLCIDDLRNVPGCYRGDAITPHLDKLAQSAAVFSRHYNQWPVCGPSRASMLGGLRPDSTGIYEIGDSYKIAKNPGKCPTLPLTFKNNGYTTLSFGKIFHGKKSGKGYGWSHDPWRKSWHCYVHFDYNPGKGVWRPAYEIYEGPDSLHTDYQTADKVIEAIKAHKDRPFFIAGGFYKPHLPFVAPQRFWDLYENEKLALLQPRDLPRGAGDYMYGWTEIASYGDPEQKTLFEDDDAVTEEQARRMTRAYYASVSFIDEQIGRILQALDDNGLTETTAVVIWSDHGFHLGDHGRWGKHTQFEPSMRCPLILRLPGHRQITGETKAIVESLDIYPTLCEFAGIPKPEFLEGESIVPILEGSSQGKQAAYSQIRPVKRKKPPYEVMAYTVRTEHFRYVEWRDLNDLARVVSSELYDHRSDPEETNNVIDDRSLQSVILQHAELIQNNFTSLMPGK